MKTPFRDGAVDLEGIRPCGLVRIRGDNILSAMVFPHASSFTGAGNLKSGLSTQVVETILNCRVFPLS